MKSTDYQKVFELAKNILTDDKQMIQLTDDLGQKLKTLEGTFWDDGIDEVKVYVKSLTSKLTNAQTAFQTIATELSEYAKLLKLGKGGK